MEKNLCRPGFALPLLMALLFAAAPAHAQELGIETVPSQPRALQEFEVWYTAGGEIESIEMPCWGSLTLVRELGRTSGTQTSVRDGVMTRSETHAYRYLVRSAVGGELVIPGTTAVVGGQTCRCDGLRVKILPALVSVQPQCRIVYDSVVSRRMGGHILRLTCDRRPDRRGPLLAVNGEDVAPLMSGYSEKNGLEEFVYHYRVAGDGPGTYSCVPRLSFGGREFAAEPYVVTVKPASAAVSFGRWWLYVPVGALLALWGAVFVRDHTVAAGRNAVVSRFSWRGYMLLALALLFVGFSAVFLCLLFAPGAKPFALYLAAAVMLFGSCWLVFGELRRSAVRLCLDAGTLCVTPYMGLGMTRRYDMHDFDGVTTSVLVSRGEVYEYRYLLKGGRREVRLSSCYLKNYARLSTAIGACCPDRGERPRDFWLELKELFR